jgi:hypothetical protein
MPTLIVPILSSGNLRMGQPHDFLVEKTDPFEARVSEDREVCAAIEARGAVIHYDASVRVVTGARRDARARLGLAHALNLIEMSVALSAGN